MTNYGSRTTEVSNNENNYASMATGERGPTMIADACKAAHKKNSINNRQHVVIDMDDNLSTGTYVSTASERSYLLQDNHDHKHNRRIDRRRTARFQVVLWYVGPINVAMGHVTMKFRISIFWNDISNDTMSRNNSFNGIGGNKPAMRRSNSFIVMKGRQQAYEEVLPQDNNIKRFDVPAVSILNAVTFDIVGEPEVTMLRSSDRLMRWTCMYKAVLLQEDMRVDKFPHDEHNLSIKLGILDGLRNDKWKLGLATEDDSQRSTRVPHGLVVDHVRVPNFSRGAKGLHFDFVPLNFGAQDEDDSDDNDDDTFNESKKAQCLRVSLHVVRNSSYYDMNILPLLMVLNLSAVSLMALDAREFFMRGLLMLNISFVEISIRRTVDSHLPSVGYQIKMQRVLNHFFFGILLMEVESSILYYLIDRKGWDVELTDQIDLVVGLTFFIYTSFVTLCYYWDAYLLSKKKLSQKE